MPDLESCLEDAVSLCEKPSFDLGNGMLTSPEKLLPWPSCG